MAVDRMNRTAWGAAMALPAMALAMWSVIGEPAPAPLAPPRKDTSLVPDRWRDPTPADEAAARQELRRALVEWRAKSPRPSSSALTPPMVRILKRWPRTDAGWRASLILCPLGGDPIESAWEAVNRPFRREVPDSYDRAVFP